MGAPSGAVLSAIIVALITLLPNEALMTWGWRIPFLLSAVLLALGLYVRHSVSESPDFEKAQQARPAQPADHGQRSGFPIVEIFKHNKKTVLLATFSAFGIFVLQGLMSNTSLLIAVDGGMSRSNALWLFAAASVLQVIAIPLYAALSDRVGRRRVLIGGFTAAIVLAWPVLALIDTGNAVLVLLGYVIAMPLVQASMYGPIAAFISEMFGTTTRYTGASLGYQLASSLGYGFAPLIASSLMAGLPRLGVAAVAGYIAVSCLVSILAVRATRNLPAPTATPAS
jgi:MFS family permease